MSTESWKRSCLFQKNKSPSSMGTGLGGYQVLHRDTQGVCWGCCRQMVAIFISVVHSGGWSENSLPSAWLLWRVLDRTCSTETATQIQGQICRWNQQYFLLRLLLFYRHVPAEVSKAFMKFIAWTIKITWIWAECLWTENRGPWSGKKSSRITLVLETVSADWNWDGFFVLLPTILSDL